MLKRTQSFCLVVALGVSVACGGQVSQRSTLDGAAGSAGGRAEGGTAGAREGDAATGGKASNTSGRGGESANGSGGESSEPFLEPAGMCDAFDSPTTCAALGMVCIGDLRHVAPHFQTCVADSLFSSSYVSRCGKYDVLVVNGIDVAARYYFDHMDGHFAAQASSGMFSSCLAVDPGFEAASCESPPACPTDAEGCSTLQPLVATAPPGFCPAPALPRPVPGTPLAAGDDPGRITLKFVEGSHVRLTAFGFLINPFTMLDEDPGLLSCAGLNAPAAECDLDILNARMFGSITFTVTRLLDQSEAELDAQRAATRDSTGQYSNDLNLQYSIQGSPDDLATLYDALARNPVVDTVYRPFR